MTERRYTVIQVMADGVPQDLSFWESLEDALSERDLLRRENWSRRIYYAVVDREDEERGALDHEDIYEEVS